jgi:hypothetical protein
MNEYDYRRIINDLNNGIVKQIRFCVDSYYHYRDCKIARIKHIVNNKIQVHHIDVSLTADSSEKISFLYEFQEDVKLFNMGKKGKFTLKQMWPRITILEIVYE